MSLLAPLLETGFLVFFVPLLVHDDPLVGTTAFWFTRPISRRTMFTAKMLFIFLLLFLVPLIIYIGILVYSKASPREIAFAILQTMDYNIPYLVCIWILATLTFSLANFILTAVMIWISYLFISIIIVAVFYKTHLSLLSPSLISPSGMISLQVISSIMTVVLGTGLIFHQYLTRKTLRTAIFSVLTVGIIITTYHFWHWDFLKRTPIPLDKKIVVTNINVIPVKKFKVIANDEPMVPYLKNNHPLKEINFPVHITGLPQGYFATVKTLSNIKISFPDKRYLYPTFNESSRIETGIQESQSRESIHGALKDIFHKCLIESKTGFLNEDIENIGMNIHVSDYTRFRRKIGILSANVLMKAFTYKIISSLPLKIGASCHDGSTYFSIIDILHETGGCTIVIRKRFMSLLFQKQSMIQRINEKFGDNYVYLLYNKKQKEIFLPDSTPDIFPFISFVELMQFGILRFQTNTPHYTSLSKNHNFVFPYIDKKWLTDADVVIVKAVYRGEFVRPLIIKNFSFGKTSSNKVIK
jgi:hypothetical protein